MPTITYFSLFFKVFLLFVTILSQIFSSRNHYFVILLNFFLYIVNTLPTAEGAIEIAISETPITLHGSKTLVLGYGKIGKILAKDLCGMGACTYVEARKYADLAMIEGHGYEPLSLGELKDNIHKFDIIFNTVPSLILDSEALERVKKDAIIIDLASKPGGAELNLNCIFLHTKIKMNFYLFTFKNFYFIYQYGKHIRLNAFKQ